MKKNDTTGQIWHDGSATLHTKTGEHPLHLRIAVHFITRFVGLMLHAPLQRDHSVLLTRCSSVNTAFMRCPIDVIYLDDDGTVLKCVHNLKPWRGSFSHTGRDEDGRRIRRAEHTLELAGGGIEQFGIRPGDRVRHALLPPCAAPSAVSDADAPPYTATQDGHVIRRRARTGRSFPRLHQSGAAMLELAVVGPVITLLGLAVLQYGLLFFAKNQINHAGFMAARAGSMGHADLSKIRQAYERALIPLYGGGRNDAELQDAMDNVRTDLKGHIQIELLNPTKESFDDWSDPVLQRTIGNGKASSGGDARVIPNSNLSSKNPNQIGSASGQNIQDANLIKLRITHGYEPKVPLIKLIYLVYLKWLDDGKDTFHTQLVNDGRIPIVTHVTLQMQSDAIEPDNPVSVSGPGNNGIPTTGGSSSPGADEGSGTPGAGNNDNPDGSGNGGADTGNPPPDCLTIGCTVGNTSATPTDPGGGGDGGGSNCVGDDCPLCPNEKSTRSPA